MGPIRPGSDHLLEPQQERPLYQQLPKVSQAKKLVRVLATSALVTKANTGPYFFSRSFAFGI